MDCSESFRGEFSCFLGRGWVLLGFVGAGAEGLRGRGLVVVMVAEGGARGVHITVFFPPRLFGCVCV
jgi:hypothetical protein